MNNLPAYVFIVDDENSLSLPAKEGDVGYDVCAVSPPRIVGEQASISEAWKRIDYIEYDLGIKIDGFQPLNSHNEDVFTLVFPRSSLSNYNLLLANSVGVVDSGYRGSLKARFKYVFQPEDLFVTQFGNVYGKVNGAKIYKKGHKVCQLIFQNHFHPQIEITDSLEESERNDGGFGSTSL